ncbi:hypothetical protein FDP41_000382 [Naegleria fowleri]|uniref:Uncharacterized protein n=1 Tax=Naegleria fowleri TaxID=5763 RepID=A0A6A5C232_NAEFO|nr:uncharacterized protein FDP41_000382 [Naegleria fowleri]KAF0984483.1 hypothetical protein FDP41_000382 [Naegleria fowleri]
MPKPSKSDNKRAQNEASSSSNEPQFAQPTPKKTRLVQSRLTFGGSSSLVGQHSFSVDQVASSSSHQDQPPIMIQSTLLPSGLLL